MKKPTDKAWQVIEACAVPGKGLRAAAGSELYPHVWTRDACLSGIAILQCARGDRELQWVADSLHTIAKHCDPLGRVPLKIDIERDRPQAENSAWVDCAPWFALAVGALARREPSLAPLELRQAACRAMAAQLYLDCDGDGLLETPEASDWADMLPHRHHVLYPNVLTCAALRACAALQAHTPGLHQDLPFPDQLAAAMQEKISLLFSLRGLLTEEARTAHLSALAKQSPEWGLTGHQLVARGELPYLLPYVAFREAGFHCDVPGNLLAVLTGTLDQPATDALLDHLERIEAGSPLPSRAIDPPIMPGSPDWRSYFTWRGLNLPEQYQNGGCWPYIGGLHAWACALNGRKEQARELIERLAKHCAADGIGLFNEWHHARTGKPMGQPRQLWSAALFLLASSVSEGSGAANLLECCSVKPHSA